jgi:hypothetical protein
MRVNLYWRLVQFWIRPYCIRRFPDDRIEGTIRQERVARRFGLRVEQGVWRRVRRVIRRRKAQRP